jgi:predicted metal-dependent hydrolase
MNTKSYTLKMSSIIVSIELKDIKNVHLSVYPPLGEVKVSAPYGTETDTLRVYISSRISWIKKQQLKFKSQKRISPRMFLTRESHYIRGKRYLLEVVESQSSPNVDLQNSKVKLYTRQSSNYLEKKKTWEKWQRQELYKDIDILLDKWTKKLDVKPIKVSIRKMKTKWGSCNPISKSININLLLVEKANKYLEYVLVHELIHLLERGHNQRFVSYMDKHLPNWKQTKSEMKKLVLLEL